jgi:hypothetical protein
MQTRIVPIVSRTQDLNQFSYPTLYLIFLWKKILIVSQKQTKWIRKAQSVSYRATAKTGTRLSWGRFYETVPAKIYGQNFNGKFVKIGFVAF